MNHQTQGTAMQHPFRKPDTRIAAMYERFASQFMKHADRRLSSRFNVGALTLASMLLLAAPQASALTAQKITGFAPTTPITYSTGDTFTLGATGGGSGNAVTFASTSVPYQAKPSACWVSARAR